MKVKMLVSMVGPNVCRKPGDVVEVSEEAGKAWIKARIAAAVEENTEKSKPIAPARAEKEKENAEGSIRKPRRGTGNRAGRAGRG